MSKAPAKDARPVNEEIIDPNGLDLFRLTMMVITASICGGIFSLAGDMAAGGPIPVRSSSRGSSALPACSRS